MSETIWKYELQITDYQTIHMPELAEILCVQVQLGRPHLWVLVHSGKKKEPRKIAIHGTGHDIPPGERYIGTVQTNQGSLVWHVFEVPPGPEGQR